MLQQKGKRDGIRHLVSGAIVDKKWYHDIQHNDTTLRYCIWRVSETTRASSDIYCQSNNDNFTRRSCAFYEKSLQVNHRQNTQKESARYCGVGREGERRDRERGYSISFYRGQLFLVLTIILNQHEIFWDIATGHIYTKLFWDACKYCDWCLRLFLRSTVFLVLWLILE